METGIIRRVDDLGRVVIPRDIRMRLNIHCGDPLEISVEDNKVCFEIYHPEIPFKDELLRLSANLRNNPIDTKTDEYIFGKINDIMDYLGGNDE